MGAAAGVSESILFSLTASRVGPFTLLLAALALAALLGWATVRYRQHVAGGGAALPVLALGLLGALGVALWAAAQLASPPVLLKATERGLTSYLTAEHPRGVRLQLARHADSDGLFIPWRAMESLALERVERSEGTAVVAGEVLAIALRPGFERLRTAGVVVAPGARRSTLDLPVPASVGGAALLAELTALRQRFSSN